jgi:hypothetical protein
MASHAATGCGDARGKTGDALSDGAIRLITCQHVLAKDQDPTNQHRRAVRVASSCLYSKRERANNDSTINCTCMSHQSQIVSHKEGVIVLEPIELIWSLARGQRRTTSGQRFSAGQVRDGSGMRGHGIALAIEKACPAKHDPSAGLQYLNKLPMMPPYWRLSCPASPKKRTDTCQRTIWTS